MPLTVLSVSYPLAQVSPRTAGGAEQVLSLLDAALVREGHRSLVLAPAGSRCYGLLIPAQVPTGVLHEAAKRESQKEFKRLLERALNDYSVDIIHMHGLDFIEYLPNCETPVLVSLHLPLSWYPRHALIPPHPRLNFVCVSKSQAGTAPPGMQIARIIPNGIEIARFQLARRKSNYALAIGRICPEKGLHLAIDAAEHASIDLVIAGSVFEYPEHRAYFELMIRPRLNDRIRFIGPVGGVRKAHLLAGARCLLLPSLAPETSALCTMEAMASGTPVVAFRTGALPEIVSPGRTGFLVDEAQEMSEAIRHVSSVSPHACRHEAEQRFCSDRMFREYLDLYRSVLAPENFAELVAA